MIYDFLFTIEYRYNINGHEPKQLAQSEKE